MLRALFITKELVAYQGEAEGFPSKISKFHNTDNFNNAIKTKNKAKEHD